LRERNDRKHQLFEQKLREARDDLQSSFNNFAGATQRAYQQLRQEIHGEKRVSLALLNELLEVGQDLLHIVASRPPADDPEAVAGALRRPDAATMARNRQLAGAHFSMAALERSLEALLRTR
ncbi:MAG TPA: hypothetical protein VG795_12845, partial [Acidimicrobiia bacterium]|nr:hypothetical protein [Acidimicrobiia bacterium]